MVSMLSLSLRLGDQMAHCLLDRTVIGNDDVVGRHPATDLFLIGVKKIKWISSLDSPDPFARDQGFFFLWIQIFEDIDRLIGIHLCQNGCRPVKPQFIQIRRRFIEIVKNLPSFPEREYCRGVSGSRCPVFPEPRQYRFAW